MSLVIAMFSGLFSRQVTSSLPKKRKKPSIQIINEGDPVSWFHRHDFKIIELDEKRYGPSVSDIPSQKEIAEVSDSYATYRTQFRCGCGREILETVRSLL